MCADPQLTEALRLWSYGVGHVAELRVREGVRAMFVEAGRLRAALIRHEMKARGAYYTDDSFYGLVHETAHGIYLEARTFDRSTINGLIAPLPARERMMCEVVAHAATRAVCDALEIPVFEDSVRYSAHGTLAFAASRGEVVDWTVEDFVAANAAMEDGERVQRIVRAILAWGAVR